MNRETKALALKVMKEDLRVKSERLLISLRKLQTMSSRQGSSFSTEVEATHFEVWFNTTHFRERGTVGREKEMVLSYIQYLNTEVRVLTELEAAIAELNSVVIPEPPVKNIRGGNRLQ